VTEGRDRGSYRERDGKRRAEEGKEGRRDQRVIEGTKGCKGDRGQ
jgi:hypothetical protein